MQNLVEEIMQESLRRQENLIQEAFREHFGFPIAEVKSNRQLTCIHQPFQVEYRYKGEAFLRYNPVPEFERKDGGLIVKINFEKI